MWNNHIYDFMIFKLCSEECVLNHWVIFGDPATIMRKWGSAVEFGGTDPRSNQITFL